jgi:hypothetical protein
MEESFAGLEYKVKVVCLLLCGMETRAKKIVGRRRQLATYDNKNILASSAPVQSKSDSDIWTLAKEGRTVADFRLIGYLFKSTLQTPSA